MTVVTIPPAENSESGFLIDSTNRELQARVERGAKSWSRVQRLSPVRVTFTVGSGVDLREGEEAPFALYHIPTGQLIESIAGRVKSIQEDGEARTACIEIKDCRSVHRRAVCGLMQQMLLAGKYVPTGNAEPLQECIAEEGRIQRIVRSLIANAAHGVARFEGDKYPPAPINAARLERESSHPLHWWMEESRSIRPSRLEIVSYNSVYLIDIEDCEARDNMLVMAMPQEITRRRVRLTRRIREQGITITFRHPVFPELRVTRPVINLSQYGLAFSTEPKNDLVYPGLELPAIVISAGERSTLLQGVVRHVSVSAIDGRQMCGVEIIPKSPFHPRLGWAHILEPLLHPETERGSAETVDGMWELLDKSGYFKLSGKQPSDFEVLREAYTQVSQHYSESPAMGCQVLWTSPLGMEATISIALMYSGTWLLYQLARRKGRSPVGIPGRQLIRHAYIHAFEHAQWYPSLNWVLAYTEANVRWHHLTHQAFAERFAESGRVLNLPFHLMEDSSSKADPTWSSPFQIGEATMSELEQFIDHTRAIYPRAVTDALDFVPSRFYLEDINRTLARANLSRDRRLFVARREGEPVAAALYETGTRGMHLFRLFDGVRLFALVEDADAAMLDLIEHARHWYAERGTESFVYYIEPSQFGLANRGGLLDLGEGYMWLIHASLIADFLEHIQRLTAPRDVPTVIEQIPGEDPG